MMHYCNLFDSQFLLRGMALLDSFKKNAAHPYHLWVLCIDNEVHRVLSGLSLEHVHLITFGKLGEAYSSFKEVRNNRSQYSYLCTSKSFLMRWILETQEDAEGVAYLDADTFLFCDPSDIWKEIDGYSILLSPHNFPPGKESKGKCGKFNAGFLAVRNDRIGNDFLHWWCDRVVENCENCIEDGIFYDQQYLDQVPRLFDRVMESKHHGINAAPWNLGSFKVEERDGKVYIDGRPLIFFHFHSLKKLLPCVYDPSLSVFGVRPNRTIKKLVYGSYFRRLHEIRMWLNTQGIKVSLGSVRKEISKKHLPQSVRRFLRGQIFIVWRGRVI